MRIYVDGGMDNARVRAITVSEITQGRNIADSDKRRKSRSYKNGSVTAIRIIKYTHRVEGLAHKQTFST